MTENQVLEFVLNEARHILGDDGLDKGAKIVARFDDIMLADFLIGLEDEFSTSFGEEFYFAEKCPLSTVQDFANYIVENADL